MVRKVASRGSQVWPGLCVLLLGAVLAAPTAVAENSWAALAPAVVDLDVFLPEQDLPTRAYGFFVEGIDGIVTCHRVVRGAERIVVQTAKGDTYEIREYVAHDPQHDLVVLKLPAEKRAERALEPSSHLLFTQGQYCFGLLPPSVQQKGEPVYEMRFVATVEAAGVGDLIALFAQLSPGLPAVDSLGNVVGVIEPLKEGSSYVTGAMPIGRVTDMMGKPEKGGALTDLAAEPVAAWTQPHEPEGAQVMGTILCRIRRFSEGLPYLSRAVQQRPAMAEAHIEWGMAHQIQKQFEDAATYYRKALEARPGYAKAHLYLGSCYFMQGRYADAEREYATAAKLAPEWPLAYVNLGGAYFVQRNRTEAEIAFTHALELDPLMGLARYNLGMLFQGDGRNLEAQEELEFLEARKSGFANLLRR